VRSDAGRTGSAGAGGGPGRAFNGGANGRVATGFNRRAANGFNRRAGDGAAGRDAKLRFRDWRFRISDILDAIEAIDEYTAGMTFEEFCADRRTLDAVVRNLMVMGESVRWVPVQVQDGHRDLPWRGMRGVRNVVVHEYFGVDPRILWETCRRDLPPLIPRLEAVLRST
jgi:uncharacterized protein with HEPN domain